jgi:hypothetical protein
VLCDTVDDWGLESEIVDVDVPIWHSLFHPFSPIWSSDSVGWESVPCVFVYI